MDVQLRKLDGAYSSRRDGATIAQQFIAGFKSHSRAFSPVGTIEMRNAGLDRPYGTGQCSLAGKFPGNKLLGYCRVSRREKAPALRMAFRLSGRCGLTLIEVVASTMIVGLMAVA